jgi:hypothetical protein
MNRLFEEMNYTPPLEFIRVHTATELSTVYVPKTITNNMTKDNFKTFEEYTGKKNKKEKSKIIDKKDNAKNEKDILADVALILKAKRR